MNQFLIPGLGVASAFGLAVLMGPLFALLYSSINVTNGANTISTSVGASRLLEKNLLKKQMLEKLTQGINILDDVLKKHHNV